MHNSEIKKITKEKDSLFDQAVFNVENMDDS